MFVAPSAPATDGSGNDNLLFRKVQTSYRATRSAIREVESSYVYSLNGMQRRCISAQSGERHYHASIDPLPKGGAMPREVAWDGQVAAFRQEIGELVVGRNREMAVRSCDIPDLVAMIYVDHALGHRPDLAHRYRLRSATRTGPDAAANVQLEFEVEPREWILRSEHSPSHGYLPLAVRLTDQTGQMLYELEEVRYKEFKRDGNSLFYPVYSVGVGYVDGKPVNRTVVETDPDTLRVNEPIKSSRFSLAPWPIDTVYDADTGRVTAATDRTWLPVGKVGFPWSVYFEAKPVAEWATIFAGKFAAGTRATDQPVAPPDAEPQLSIAAASSDSSEWWWFPMGAGVALIGGVIAWRLHQRRVAA